MRGKRKNLSLLLALMLSMQLCLVGCGNNIEPGPALEDVEVSVEGTESEVVEDTTVEETVTEDEEEVKEEVTEEVKEETKEEITEETTEEVTEEVVEEVVVEVSESVAFVSNLKLGWNLGNTLDATGGRGLDSERSWGQPKTTKELIDYVKSVGFTTIRIPVSWGRHTDKNNGYKIDEEWMNRVQEVVDYAVANDMYIILNAHHDNSYYYPSDQKFNPSLMYMEAIWAQIAERFKDYDEKLIFESMNEPRLEGTDKEWWFAENDKEGVASIRVIMKLNQAFVDTVRATGGNNATRYLMVPSHAASVDTALNKVFEMPEDPANRMILSVHAYTPYDFAMNANGYSNWDGSKSYELNFMNRLNEKFIENGVGVIIGEFGTTNKDNLQSRVNWSKEYTTKAAGYGISCILWDNGGTNVGEENFGMIDRKNLKVYFPEVLDALLSGYEK